MLIIRRFPIIVRQPIGGAKELHQWFILPGLLIGKGYFTIVWLRSMLTVNFNTTIEIEEQETEDGAEPG